MKKLLLTSLTLFLGASSLLHAAEASGTLATVNGIRIDNALLEMQVAGNKAQGNEDTPQLRSFLKTELIAREVLAQEARKQGLDKDPNLIIQIQQQQNALLIDTLIARHLQNFNITEEMLQSEYKRQTDFLSGAQEYQISQILCATESEAQQIIKSAQNGIAFDKLAKEKSVDPNKENSGYIGWLRADQMSPQIAQAVTKLAVPSITPKPIQIQQGWLVINLSDKRNIKIPSYEQSRSQLINALLINEKAQYVERLVKSAKIQ